MTLIDYGKLFDVILCFVLVVMFKYSRLISTVLENADRTLRNFEGITKGPLTR